MDSNKSEPFVSILTPVYNGEKYLSECIESVLRQTYENWEYVIVNNKSMDASLAIAEKYAETDPRIRIHNNENFLEVMDSLNHSFHQISPESRYCKVIHADDWMFPECVEKMVEIFEKYPSAGIVGSYRLIGKKVGTSGLPYPSHSNDGKKISRDFLLNEDNYFGAPSNLLIRSDLIRKRKQFYDPDYLQSDLSACLDILEESDFGFVHQVLTFTRRHKESVTETKAKKFSAQMYGYLKMVKDYAPVYLSDDEASRVVDSQLNKFYIQFARDMFDYGVRESYVRHRNELQSLNYSVNQIKLGTYLIREIIVMLIHSLGYEAKKISGKRDT